MVELVISNRNVARAVEMGGVETGRRHYRWMVVLHTLFFFACALEVVALDRPFSVALGSAALFAALLAQALRYWSVAALGGRWNTRIVVLPSEPFVTRGPYRYMRHPNYLAVVVEMAAVPLIHGAWLTALVFSVANALVLFVRIKAEEAALGADWEKVFAGKPRFVPEVRRG